MYSILNDIIFDINFAWMINQWSSRYFFIDLFTNSVTKYFTICPSLCITPWKWYRTSIALLLFDIFWYSQFLQKSVQVKTHHRAINLIVQLELLERKTFEWFAINLLFIMTYKMYMYYVNRIIIILFTIIYVREQMCFALIRTV